MIGRIEEGPKTVDDLYGAGVEVTPDTKSKKPSTVIGEERAAPDGVVVRNRAAHEQIIKRR